MFWRAPRFLSASLPRRPRVWQTRNCYQVCCKTRFIPAIREIASEDSSSRIHVGTISVAASLRFVVLGPITQFCSSTLLWSVWHRDKSGWLVSPWATNMTKDSFDISGREFEVYPFVLAGMRALTNPHACSPVPNSTYYDCWNWRNDNESFLCSTFRIKFSKLVYPIRATTTQL